MSLIDVVVISDKNTSSKTFEKLSKYKKHKSGERIQNLKKGTLTVIIGIISGANIYVEQILSSAKFWELQTSYACVLLTFSLHQQ